MNYYFSSTNLWKEKVKEFEFLLLACPQLATIMSRYIEKHVFRYTKMIYNLEYKLERWEHVDEWGQN